MTNQTTLIIGANSTIAKALALQVIGESDSNIKNNLIVITRDTEFYQHKQFNNSKIINIKDYQESSIKNVISEINTDKTVLITQVFICHGLLHNDTISPEKRLQEFSAESFTEVLTANTITPILWIKNLTSTLKSKNPCKVVIFTARVGSISDNKTGGWYSYRASKAALNMLLKSTAVELSRTTKNIKLVSFHPGTTDTPLSKPFQKNVPEEKLFSSTFVACQLIKILEQIKLDGEVSFIDWQGKDIPW